MEAVSCLGLLLQVAAAAGLQARAKPIQSTLRDTRHKTSIQQQRVLARCCCYESKPLKTPHHTAHL